MSLVSEYNKNLRESLGLSVTENSLDNISTGDGSGGGSLGTEPVTMESCGGGLGEDTMNKLIEMLKEKIAQQEGANALAPTPATIPSPLEEVQSDQDNAQTIADDIYFEMLGEFKNKVAGCKDDLEKKKAYSKVYNFLYKMREKFIGEMTASDENE